MDYFAHGFWAYIFFHRIKKPIYAVLCALIPDTFSWGIYLFYLIFNGGFTPGRPNIALIPDWTWTLYGISHSVFVALLMIVVVYLIFRYLKKEFPIYVLAWPLSIIMDIPTHSREIFPTPFLWPVSTWKFPGFSWSNGVFMAINYSLIIGSIIYIWKKNIQIKRKEGYKEFRILSIPFFGDKK